MLGKRICEAAFAHGLVIYGSGDAWAHDEIFISPPLIVTKSDIDEIMDRFSRTIEDVVNSLPAGAWDSAPVRDVQSPVGTTAVGS
jgi:adenosylmethionine-8-amino-7-oxononanoate aminotransferase